MQRKSVLVLLTRNNSPQQLKKLKETIERVFATEDEDLTNRELRTLAPTIEFDVVQELGATAHEIGQTNEQISESFETIKMTLEDRGYELQGFDFLILVDQASAEVGLEPNLIVLCLNPYGQETKLRSVYWGSFGKDGASLEKAAEIIPRVFSKEKTKPKN